MLSKRSSHTYTHTHRQLSFLPWLCSSHPVAGSQTVRPWEDHHTCTFGSPSEGRNGSSVATPKGNGSHLLQVTCPIPWKFLTVETILLITTLSLLIQLWPKVYLLRRQFTIKGSDLPLIRDSLFHSKIHLDQLPQPGPMMGLTDKGHFLTLF